MVYYNTVNALLQHCLKHFMEAVEFKHFRLVGGTALSLQIGHRKSADIDLFSDTGYGSIDFEAINTYLQKKFPYVDQLPIDPAFGKSYFVGESPQQNIKVDVYYTDTFIQPPTILDHIRMATTAEIAAMKIDVIQRGGRKKDFWDIHALFEIFSLRQMLELHQQRYPFTHNKKEILKNIIDFKQADDDFDPICLRGNYWEFIKEDIETTVCLYKKQH